MVPEAGILDPPVLLFPPKENTGLGFVSGSTCLGAKLKGVTVLLLSLVVTVLVCPKLNTGLGFSASGLGVELMEAGSDFPKEKVGLGFSGSDW